MTYYLRYLVLAFAVSAGLFPVHCPGDQPGPERFDRLITVTQEDPRFSNAYKARHILELKFDRDREILRTAVEAKDSTKVSEAAAMIYRNWNETQSDYSAPLLAEAAARLLPNAEPGAVSWDLAMRLGSSAIDHLETTKSLKLRDYALTTLTAGPAGDPNNKHAIASYLDKNRLLSVELGMYQEAVNVAAISLPEQLKPFTIYMRPEAVNLLSSFPDEYFKSRATEIENFYRHQDVKEQWEHFVKTNSFTGFSRIETFPRQIAWLVKARFNGGHEDLLSVHRALQQCISDPELRDRLITAIYGPENPFLSLPPESHGTSSGPTLAQVSKRPITLQGGTFATERIPSISSPALDRDGPIPGGKSSRLLPIAAVLAAGLILCWLLSRSRPS